MKWISTTPTNRELEVMWLLDEPISGNQVARMSFSHIGLGISWDPSPFGVVVGQRVIWNTAGQPARYWVVLDELKPMLLSELFQKAIELKDQYRITHIYTTNQPAEQVQALYRLEGLSYYLDQEDWQAQAKWPSFCSVETTAHINARPLPEPQAMHTEIESWLTTPVTVPDTGAMIPSALGVQLKQIQLPEDLPTQYTVAGLKQASPAPCQALYMPVSAMMRMHLPQKREPESEWGYQPSRRTGY